jgi:hypothetical protein
VPAAQVLHERVPSRHGAQRADRLQSEHWPQSGLESAVIGFDAVVRVLLEDMPRSRNELVDDARVDRRPIGGDLDRRSSAGEEWLRRRIAYGYYL